MTMDILQDHSREPLRASLIQQLGAFSQNEDEFLRYVDYLAGTHLLMSLPAKAVEETLVTVMCPLL